MVACDWLKGNFSCPLLSQNGPVVRYGKNYKIVADESCLIINYTFDKIKQTWEYALRKCSNATTANFVKLF